MHFIANTLRGHHNNVSVNLINNIAKICFCTSKSTCALIDIKTKINDNNIYYVLMDILGSISQIILH